VIRVEIDEAAFTSLFTLAQDSGRSGEREIKVAINRTAKETSSWLARTMGKRMTIKAADLRKSIKFRTTGKTATAVEIPKNARLSLKRLKPSWRKTSVAFKPGSNPRRKVEGAFMGPKHPEKFTRFAIGHVFKRKDWTAGGRGKKTAKTGKRTRTYKRRGKTYTYQATRTPDQRQRERKKARGYWRKYTTKRPIQKLHWASVTHIHVSERFDVPTVQYIISRLNANVQRRVDYLWKLKNRVIPQGETNAAV
jgi:hypothetical protein